MTCRRLYFEAFLLLFTKNELDPMSPYNIVSAHNEHNSVPVESHIWMRCNRLRNFIRETSDSYLVDSALLNVFLTIMIIKTLMVVKTLLV